MHHFGEFPETCPKIYYPKRQEFTAVFLDRYRAHAAPAFDRDRRPGRCHNRQMKVGEREREGKKREGRMGMAPSGPSALSVLKYLCMSLSSALSRTSAVLTFITRRRLWDMDIRPGWVIFNCRVGSQVLYYVHFRLSYRTGRCTIYDVLCGGYCLIWIPVSMSRPNLRDTSKKLFKRVLFLC